MPGKQCSCPDHNRYASSGDSVQQSDALKGTLVSIKSKSVPQWVKNYLGLSSGKIGKHVCRGCIEYARQQNVKTVEQPW